MFSEVEGIFTQARKVAWHARQCTVRHGTALHGTALNCVAQLSTAQHGTACTPRFMQGPTLGVVTAVPDLLPGYSAYYPEGLVRVQIKGIILALFSKS